MEIWKPVIDSPLHEASSKGRIRNVKTGKIVKGSDNGRGYKYFSITIGDKQGHLYIHRVVADCFLSPDSSRPDTNHKNGKKHDNTIENLERCNKFENMRHAYKAKLLYNPNAKLTERDVDLIRKLWVSGVHREQISEVFCIRFPQISRIVNRINWK